MGSIASSFIAVQRPTDMNLWITNYRFMLLCIAHVCCVCVCVCVKRPHASTRFLTGRASTLNVSTTAQRRTPRRPMWKRAVHWPAGKWIASVASLGLLTPGVATDDVTSPFFAKKMTTFLVIAVCKVMTSLAVVSSQLPASDVLFLNSATFFIHLGVTPWMVSPGAVRPPPSDATKSLRVTVNWSAKLDVNELIFRRWLSVVPGMPVS